LWLLGSIFIPFYKAKISLEKGIKIEPNNHKAIFQLGNILLMEKNYLEKK